MSTPEKIVEALLGDQEDPKDFLAQMLESDPVVVCMCAFTSQGETQPHPEYFSDEVGDWDRDWNNATLFRLTDFAKDGVLDLNDLPFGCEALILVNKDGSPGETIPVEKFTEQFPGDVGRVIDTYVSPDPDNEAHRDANPGEYFPRE